MIYSDYGIKLRNGVIQIVEEEHIQCDTSGAFGGVHSGQRHQR